jgi:hypothetical protein
MGILHDLEQRDNERVLETGGVQWTQKIHRISCIVNERRRLVDRGMARA